MDCCGYLCRRTFIDQKSWRHDFFPFLVLAISRYGWRSLLTIKPGTESAVLALLLVPLGLFSYMLFLHLHVGDALAFKNIQIAWARIPGNPITVIFNALSQGNTYQRNCGFLALLGLLTGLFLYKKKFYLSSFAIASWVVSKGYMI